MEVASLLAAFDAQDQIRPATSPAVALRFGPYEVEQTIGQGGMGAVYLANRVDGEFRQRVAIKVVSRQGFGDLFLERFRLERQILASLNHPGVTRLLDGGVGPDGSVYLAMEYVEGVRIDRYCDENRPSRRARLHLFQAVCTAVQYAHRNLVVHRDLKPDNILVQEDGAPKLLDFGAAKLLTPLEASAETELTRAGYHAFTPAFASPEQVLGRPVTTASEIYSLGVMLYRLLSGRAPYDMKDSTTGVLVDITAKPWLNSAVYWMPAVMGFITTPEHAGQVQEILWRSAVSAEANSQWVAQQQKTTMATSHIFVQSSHAVDELITKSYWSTQARYERRLSKRFRRPPRPGAFA